MLQFFCGKIVTQVWYSFDYWRILKAGDSFWE